MSSRECNLHFFFSFKDENSDFNFLMERLFIEFIKEKEKMF